MPTRKNDFKKRAAISGALFLFFVFSAHAEKLETYKDIIEKAYTLSLQKDREQAVAILINAIKREVNAKKLTNPPPKDLLAALDEVSTVFYSDKVQQLYELALSLKISDPAMALVKLNEAAKTESNNANIQIEITRLQIATGDCSQAYSQLTRLREVNPYNEYMKLHLAQAAICSGKFDYYKQNKPTDLKKTGLLPFWQMVEVEYLFKTDKMTKAIQIARQVEKNNTNYPEPLYWQWKISEELKTSENELGEKYVSDCKKLTSRQLRKYSGDPLLCRRTSEVENRLKKTDNVNL